MTDQFDFVSIQKKANVYFKGSSISHAIVLKDGSKKTLGVILPTEQPLTFKTNVAERIEIISGQCQVQIGNNKEIKIFYAGESFNIPRKSEFKIQSLQVVDYICHFEK